MQELCQGGKRAFCGVARELQGAKTTRQCVKMCASSGFRQLIITLLDQYTIRIRSP